MADARPKYQRLVDHLRGLIADLPIGASVPSERALADDSGVSRMTARKALDALEAEGLLRREVGRGTFVARPAVSLPLMLTSFTEDMRARGLQPSSRLLDARHLVADAELASVFGIAVGEALVRVERLRLADGAPFAIERTTLLDAAVPGILDADLAAGSLYEILDREHGIRFDAGHETIRAALVDPGDAAILELADQGAVLELVRTSIAAGVVVEHTVSTYPGDRFELSASIAPVTADGSARSALRAR
ncbi:MULTISPECIES: GntR family transcriptional regulator [unclassified Agrococcus]|uniref:GntR family transcriptional regulator n=1 Tax=unclassified Agrococcus TaxID=2615065 RepID=UPI003612A8B8